MEQLFHLSSKVVFKTIGDMFGYGNHYFLVPYSLRRVWEPAAGPDVISSFYARVTN